MTLRPFFAALFVLFVSFGCKKASEKQAPLITTLEVESNGDLSVSAGGRIYEVGGDEITECGLCWSKSIDPTVSDNHVKAELSGSVFTQTISDLEAFTNYFVRAYATNKYGTTYGTSESVNSGAPPQPPVVNTRSLVALSTTGFTLSGLLGTKLKQIKEAGVCWNTTGDPSIDNNKSTTTTFSTTTFTTEVQGLSANTIIFARTYAINNAGISYGEQIVLKTYYSTMTDHEGNTYFTTLINGKEWMAQNLRCRTLVGGQKIELISGDFNWSTNVTNPICCLISPTGSISANEGLLYNNILSQSQYSIAPAGWHVPSATEYDNLVNGFSGQNPGLCLARPVINIWPVNYYPSQLTAFDARANAFRYSSGSFSSYFNYSYYMATGNRALMVNGFGSAYTTYTSTGDGYCIRLVKD